MKSLLTLKKLYFFFSVERKQITLVFAWFILNKKGEEKIDQSQNQN